MSLLTHVHCDMRFAAVFAAFAAGIGVSLCTAAVARSVRTWRMRRRFRRGTQGEREALSFLKKNGFRDICDQVEMKETLVIDGTAVEFTLRADFTAVRKGKTCVIEVKTGKQASIDPFNRDIRRQLLEYALYYKADEVLLYNADTAELHDIGFTVLKRKSERSMILPFLGGVLSGAAGAVLFFAG